MSTMFTIGDVECPITNLDELANTRNMIAPTKEATLESATRLVPKNLPYVLEEDKTKDYTKKVLLAAAKDQPILLVGPKGTGKTTSIYYLAQQTNNPLVPIQLNGSTGVDSLVGKWLVGKDGTYRVDGLFTMAWRYGYWIILDELNMCLDKETEVLTTNGRKNYDCLTKNDKVATMNCISEEIEYHKPKEIKIFDYEGDMVHLSGRHHEQLITPNHRVMYKEKHITYKKDLSKSISTKRGEYKTVKDKIYKFGKIKDMNEIFNGLLIPISGKKEVVGDYYIGIEKSELLGRICTDGHIHKKGGIYIYQSRSANEKKCMRIEALLYCAGIKYTKKLNDKKTSVGGKEYTGVMAEYYLSEGSVKRVYDLINKETKIPFYDVLDKLTGLELRSLYNGILLGDGDDGKNITIGKKNIAFMYFVQALLTNINKGFSFYERQNCFHVTTTNKSETNLIDMNGKNKKAYRKIEKYKGVVWCLEIANGNFCIRRKDANGHYKASFTGNCLPEIIAILHPALDDRRVLVLDEKDGEVVQRHPNCRVFAAVNPAEDYAGTKEMNAALVDRFAGQIIVPYPDSKKEIAIVLSHKKVAIDDEAQTHSKEGIITRMVKVANAYRKLRKEQTLMFECSTRNLIDRACRCSSLTIKEAFEFAVLSKADKEDYKTMQDEVNKFFPDDARWEPKAMKIKKSSTSTGRQAQMDEVTGEIIEGDLPTNL